MPDKTVPRRPTGQGYIYVDATPNQLGFTIPTVGNFAVKLEHLIPIHEAEALAATMAVCMMGPGANVHTDNTISLFCLRKRNARNAWIQHCIHNIFKAGLYDKFRFHYIASEENPADMPSNANL